MNGNKSEQKTTTASVYHLLQNPAPICMFYFAHPFGITSPASGAKLAQIRANATQGSKQNGPSTEQPAIKSTTGKSAVGEPKQQRKANGKLPDGVRHPSKSHHKLNGLCSSGSVDSNVKAASHLRESQRKHKKHRTHRRISNFEKFLLEIQHSHTCGRGSTKVRRIDREDRLTPLVPWPSTIWNREFLLPTLLQALAQQHALGGEFGESARGSIVELIPARLRGYSVPSREECAGVRVCHAGALPSCVRHV